MTTQPISAGEAWALRMLSTAKGYVGENRQNSQEQITKFLNLFDLGFSEGGSPLPFCAAGASWCGLKALAEIRHLAYTPDTLVDALKALIPDFTEQHFQPSASCGVIVGNAKSKEIWLPRATPYSSVLPGYLVFFDFGGHGYADHVELVDRAFQNHLIDVGFNTTAENSANGGAVAYRTRPYHEVFGYVKTY